MRFYINQHSFYCGIDLHARSMYVCTINHDGDMLLHRNIQAAPEPFLKAVALYRDGLIVAVECIFTWYWLADLGQPPASQLRLWSNYPHHALCRGASARGDASRPPRQGTWLPYRCQHRMQHHELFIFEHLDPDGAVGVGPDRLVDAGKIDINTTSA